MRKKILIHSIVFNPDGVSTAYLYGDIAVALQKAGYEVEVLTTTPHYNAIKEQVDKQPSKWKIWGFLKKSSFNGIPVYHVPQKKFKSTVLRLCGFVYWHIVSFLTALFMKKVDIILSPSPPLTIGLLNLWIGKFKKAKVVYNVQEVYPDILGKDSGLVYKILSKIERMVYDQSDAIVTIDKVFHNTIVDRFKDPSKLKVIPNFVDTDLYRPLKESPNLDKKLFKDNGNLKILYAGNIGKAQEWDTLVAVAQKILGSSVDFYVIGEGAMKEYLKHQIDEKNLYNIHLLPYQPRELMPEILAFSDIQFIFMEPQIAAQGFPSKVYTIMASGKPLLVCSPMGSPIVNFLADIDCAKLITETTIDRKAEAVCQWLNNLDLEQLKTMGNNGLREIRNKYTKVVITKRYAKLMDSLLSE